MNKKKVIYRTRTRNQRDDLNCIPSYSVEYWLNSDKKVLSHTWPTGSLHNAQRTYRRLERLGSEPTIVISYVADMQLGECHV